MIIFLDQTQCGKFSSIWVKIKLLLHSIIFYEKYIFHVALVYFDENATSEIMGGFANFNYKGARNLRGAKTPMEAMWEIVFDQDCLLSVVSSLEESENILLLKVVHPLLHVAP